MSDVILLDKTRKIGNLLHNSSSTKVVFSDMCRIMTEILDSNVLVISKKGKILGNASNKNVPLLTGLISDEVGSFVDKALNERFLSVLSTKENCNLLTLGFDFKGMSDYRGIVSPIDVAGERYGTLFVYKRGSEYNIDDIILSEYCVTVVGLEIMRAESDELFEDERKLESMQSALDALTGTEKKAVRIMLSSFEGDEGLIITSHIADEAKITRSVLVNALKKLESAGVIEAKSLGVKGTKIKVLNDSLRNAVKK